MNLYDKASLILTPNAYKASKLYALKPTDGSGDFTFSRASAKRRRNASGALEALANNLPAIEYPFGGGCPSILLEPQRTNIVFHSANFAGAGWLTNGATVTSSTEVSPIEGQAVSRVTTTAVSFSGIYRAVTGASGVYSIQVFAKKKDLNFLGVVDVAGNATVAWFNIGNGTIGSVNAGYSATIEPAANGFYRVTVSRTGAAQTATIFQIMFTSTNGSTIGAVGESFLAYAGIELGAFATSPIVTAGATMTRVSDGISVLNNSALFGGGSCTWFIHVKNNISVANDGTHIAGPYISNGTQGLFLATTTSGRLRVWTAAAGSVFQTTADEVKLAVVCNGATVDVFQNGVKVLTGFNYAFSFNRVGVFAPNVPLYLQGMHLYPGILTDAECIALTT